MKYNSKTPIYIQIVELIIMDVIKGNIKPGDKFKTIKEMSLEYHVNPNTIQSVFKELESMQLINSVRGLGIFLTEDTNQIKKVKEEFIEERTKLFLKDMYHIGFSKEEVLYYIEKMKGE